MSISYTLQALEVGLWNVSLLSNGTVVMGIRPNKSKAWTDSLGKREESFCQLRDATWLFMQMVLLLANMGALIFLIAAFP